MSEQTKTILEITSLPIQLGQVIRPQVVYHAQRDLSFQLGPARNPALKYRLAIRMNPVALAFDGQIIPVQELALVQVLALHKALNGSRVVAEPNVEVAILHHQRVFQGDKETRAPQIALPAGASAKLVVDATALVPVRADYVQAPQPSHSLAEANVRAPSRHVRR
jgi:hypothetical protein